MPAVKRESLPAIQPEWVPEVKTALELVFNRTKHEFHRTYCDCHVCNTKDGPTLGDCCRARATIAVGEGT